MPKPIRSTQRVPLSCTECYARKVKCSKEIPCRACINRGVARKCRRETVRVRGQLRTADTPSSSQTYSELLLENARLAGLLNNCAQPSRSDQIPREPVASLVDITEQYEHRLRFSINRSTRKRGPNHDRDHILMPSKPCSDALLAHAEVWTSWIHAALDFSQFWKEHEELWSRLNCDSSVDIAAYPGFWHRLRSENPLWLAVYYGVLSSTLLFMNSQEFVRIDPPLHNQEALLQIWYDTALHYLDQADFMQKTDLVVVQAIAVLGVVATNIGDAARHSHLWACALRIAEELKIGVDYEHLIEGPSLRETRRRLWWTLVICEWIAIPNRPPSINDTDFHCELPTVLNDEPAQGKMNRNARALENGPQPIQYHIVLSKIAIVVYQFRSKLRIRRWNLEEVARFVFTADDQLAMLINELPTHLQNDEPQTPATIERDLKLPWIPWQRRHLTMAFLYFRISVNRTLQSHWLEGSTQYARARSICLSSAIAIIDSAVAAEMDFSRLRPWALAMEVFSATITLALERNAMDGTVSDISTSINRGIRFLRVVEGHNMVAREAIPILAELIDTYE